MIIYNVTIKVENTIAEKWITWMKKEHIPELMQTGLFIDYRLCKLLEQDETDSVTYAVQYFCTDLAAYNKYINEHAQNMRDKGFKRFGDKFIAFRSLMEVIE